MFFIFPEMISHLLSVNFVGFCEYDRKWDLPDWLNHNSAEGEKCIREVVQVCPWSSGPMIFTCLEIDFGKGFKQRCFEWINDPTVKNEYDYDGGRMWV